MSNPSNLYAEKVFAEHPISLWPLDDQVDYISLISEDQRDFANTDVWQISGGTAEPDYLLNTPFDLSHNTIFETTGTDIVLSAPNLISGPVSQRLNTISFGFHAYEEVDLEIQDKIVESFTFSLTYDSEGQPYFDNDTTESITISTKAANKWHYYSHTFALPDEEVVALDAVTELTVGTPTNFELSSHGLSENDKVMLTVNGQLPSGFYTNTVYYVHVVDSNNFNLALEADGSLIEATAAGVNTPSIVLIKNFDLTITANMDRVTPATFYINGLTAGQWSEEFQESSLGISTSSAPNINLGYPYTAIPSSAYGLSDSTAYYISNNNELLARNINMPMVFGSRNLTSLVDDLEDSPSVIFPGNGFLNANGQYRTYTLEFWLKINANTFRPRRIFGPIASDDGLYIDGPFMILKIGDTIGSHYVGDMYRPMLLNIIVFENGASLTINGEKVLDITYNTASLSLPDNLSSDGYEQDWLGFYSYSDISRVELDCFAIYPYRVPTAVSKRRYVYGQAIDFPENITSAYNGKSFPVDYTFARYSNNYVYPDIGQWNRGISENLTLEKNVLAPPKYELPDVIFNNKSSESWYTSLDRSFSNSISLKPDSSWNNTDGYIYFNSLNLGERETKAFYGVFEARVTYEGTETLFTIENQINKNYLVAELHTETYSATSDGSDQITSTGHGLKEYDIIKFSGTLPAEIIANKEYFVKYVDANTIEVSEDKDGSSITISSGSFTIEANFIRYRLKYGSADVYTVYQTPAITLGTTFVAGISFTDFANTFGGNVSSFINNKAPLRLYVGGSRDFANTFSGYIYRIGFATKKNLSKLSYLFDTNGVPFLRYQFDGGGAAVEAGSELIDAGSAYQIFIDDIISHKASYTLFVKSDFGKLTLDIATDSEWQDYIPLQYFAKTIVNDAGKKKYGLNFLQFNIDYPAPRRFDGIYYDSDRSWVKTYISFQYVEDGANKLDSDFTSIKPLSINNVVSPGSDWETSKYEVVDGTVIYLPSGIDFSKLAIVIQANISVDGILSRPVRIKKLGLASKALNAVLSNKIPSRLGSYLVPYVEYGYYQDSDGYNPFTTYNDSTPHLYLTQSSGIQLRGTFPSETDRGILMRINPERKDVYSLSALQLSIYFDNLDYLSEEDVTIFEFQDRLSTYLIKASSIDPENRRAKIYATDADGTVINTVGFYLNGVGSTSPVITTREWNMLAMAFVNPLDMNRRAGAFKVTGPVLFNNISYYGLTTLQEAQRADGTVYSDYVEEDYIGVDPARLYSIYTGTNKIITGDDVVFRAQQYRYSAYKDLSLQTITVKPV